MFAAAVFPSFVNVSFTPVPITFSKTSLPFCSVPSQSTPPPSTWISLPSRLHFPLALTPSTENVHFPLAFSSMEKPLLNRSDTSTETPDISALTAVHTPRFGSLLLLPLPPSRTTPSTTAIITTKAMPPMSIHFLAPPVPGRTVSGMVGKLPAGCAPVGGVYAPCAGCAAGGVYAPCAGCAAGGVYASCAGCAAGGVYAPCAGCAAGGVYAPCAGCAAGGVYAPCAGGAAGGVYAPCAGCTAGGVYAPCAGCTVGSVFTGAPQFSQNFTPEVISLPQLLQIAIMCSSSFALISTSHMNYPDLLETA